MPTNGNGQFEYPTTGWSTGRMRKKGWKPDFEHAFGETAPAAGEELTPAQQVFERSRPELGEKASGRAVATPSDVTMGQLMLRGPAGQVVAGTALGSRIGEYITDPKVQEKVKKHLKDFASGAMELAEFATAMGVHGWRVQREAEAK